MNVLLDEPCTQITFTYHHVTGQTNAQWAGLSIPQSCISSIESYLLKALKEAIISAKSTHEPPETNLTTDVKREVLDPDYQDAPVVFEVDVNVQIEPDVNAQIQPDVNAQIEPDVNVHIEPDINEKAGTQLPLGPGVEPADQEVLYSKKRRRSSSLLKKDTPSRQVFDATSETAFGPPSACVPVKYSNESRDRLYTKKDHCYFCHKYYLSRIMSHYKAVHSDKAIVIDIISISDEERKSRCSQKLVNLGNFIYNTQVLAKKEEGELIVVQTSTVKADASKCLPCEFCYGFFQLDILPRHYNECCLRPLKVTNTSVEPKNIGRWLLAPFLHSEFTDGADRGVSAFIDGIQENSRELMDLILKDSLVLEYAKHKLNRVYQKDKTPKSIQSLQERLKSIEMLLRAVQPESKEFISFNALLCAKHSDKVAKAVNATIKSYGAQRQLLIRFIKQVTKVKIGMALKVHNLSLLKEAEEFEHWFDARESSEREISIPNNYGLPMDEDIPNSQPMQQDILDFISTSQISSLDPLSFNAEINDYYPNCEADALLLKCAGVSTDYLNHQPAVTAVSLPSTGTPPLPTAAFEIKELSSPGEKPLSTTSYQTKNGTIKEFWSADEIQLFDLIHHDHSQMPSRPVMDVLCKALPNRKQSAIRARASNVKKKVMRRSQTTSPSAENYNVASGPLHTLPHTFN